MVTKTAKVKYTPTVENVMDTITASHNGKELISKTFYIAAVISFKAEPTSMNVNEKINVILYTVKDTTDRVLANNFKVVDNLGNTVMDEESVTLVKDGTFSWEYIPVASQIETGVQFTVSYEVEGYSFTETTNVIPVIGDTGDYQLTIGEGKLINGTESTVVLSSDNTTIETGETINFSSEQGLNADVLLDES